MKRENLKLHKMGKEGVCTVIKSRHGRQIYWELDKIDDCFTAKKCFYLDRIRGGEYYTAPKKFITTEFVEEKILSVVAKELDRKYFGVEYVDDSVELTENEFIEKELNLMKKGYKLLIFVGEGMHVNGLPSTLTTRLANCLHQKIYLKIRYYRDGIGVIEDCHYFDRKYKGRTKVIPQMLTTVFVEYNREEILSAINRELACDFTDIIIADYSIDMENNLVAICEMYDYFVVNTRG